MWLPFKTGTYRKNRYNGELKMGETRFIKTKKERNYTVLDNTFLKDKSLSWKAKGLMAYFLSLPDDWTIHFSEIEKHATDGKSSLRSAINELKEKGYLRAEQKRVDNRFAEMVYTIIENPAEDFPLTDFQKTEKQKTEKQFTENQPLQNTNNNKLLKGQNTYCSCSTQQQLFQKPTIKEIADYCAERKNKIDPAYFFDYYETKGWKVGKHKMTDWKACIRNWERKDPAEAPKEEKEYIMVCEICGHSFDFNNDWECPKCHSRKISLGEKKAG